MQRFRRSVRNEIVCRIALVQCAGGRETVPVQPRWVTRAAALTAAVFAVWLFGDALPESFGAFDLAFFSLFRVTAGAGCLRLIRVH